MSIGKTVKAIREVDKVETPFDNPQSEAESLADKLKCRDKLVKQFRLIDYHYLCRHFIGRFSANGLISKERTKCLSNDNDYRGDITNKLMLALTKWDGRGSLYAYIYSQAEYGHKIYVKKRNKIKELNNQQSFDDTAIDKDFAPEIELTDYVDNILDELPEEDRLIITLKFWGKLSGRKISKEIGRSRQYIKSRTNYLLSQMRDKNDQIAI